MRGTEALHVAIADDHDLMRMGIAELLLPDGSPAVAHLRERGYACTPAGTRLVLGQSAAQPALLYAEPFGAG